MVQAMVGPLQAGNHGEFHGVIGLEFGVGLFLREMAAQRPLTWVWKFLGDTESRVAGGLSADPGKWPRTAIAVVAEREYRIGQAAFLTRPLARRFVFFLSRQNLRIPFKRFRDGVIEAKQAFAGRGVKRKQCY